MTTTNIASQIRSHFDNGLDVTTIRAMGFAKTSVYKVRRQFIEDGGEMARTLNVANCPTSVVTGHADLDTPARVEIVAEEMSAHPAPATNRVNVADGSAFVRNLNIVRDRLAGEKVAPVAERYEIGKQRVTDIFGAVKRLAKGEDFGPFAKTAGVSQDMADAIIDAVGGKAVFA